MSATTDAPWDVAIVGAGPAGAACAMVCARGGLRTLVLDRADFPRDKVCGDCLNPLAWPVLDRLGVADAVQALPHARVRRVEFWDADRQRTGFELPEGGRGEIAVPRRDFDALLLQQAQSGGAQVFTGAPLVSLDRASGIWTLRTADAEWQARWLVAADGRNSTVARLLGLLPKARRDRVGLQTHFPLPSSLQESVAMRFLPWGYCGVADVGAGHANICLVSRPGDLPALQAWATEKYCISPDAAWRSIAPLARDPLFPAWEGLLIVGDAARVVEPFTGEGIAYALATGELAGTHLLAGDPAGYAQAHTDLYQGRLWVNQLARFACESPRAARLMLRVADKWPGLLQHLTRKVISRGEG